MAGRLDVSSWLSGSAMDLSNTWEPEANLTNCPELLSEYWASVQATEVIRQEKLKAQGARKRVKAKRSGKLKRMH